MVSGEFLKPGSCEYLTRLAGEGKSKSGFNPLVRARCVLSVLCGLVPSKRLADGQPVPVYARFALDAIYFAETRTVPLNDSLKSVLPVPGTS